MIKINNSTNDITLIKRDTGSFTIGVTNIPFINGYTVHFGVKKSMGDTAYLIHKVITTFVNNKAEVNIESIDTANLNIGEYIYSIKLIRNTIHDTLITEGYAKFTIKGGVINE